MLLQGNQSEQPKRDPKQEIVHLQMRIGSSFSLAASEETVKSVLPPSNRLTSRHHTRTTAKIDDLQPAATTTNQGHHGRKSRTRSDQPTRTQHTKQNKKKKTQTRSHTLYFSGLAFSGRERSGVDGDGYADGFTQHTHSPPPSPAPSGSKEKSRTGPSYSHEVYSLYWEVCRGCWLIDCSGRRSDRGNLVLLLPDGMEYWTDGTPVLDLEYWVRQSLIGCQNVLPGNKINF